MELGNAVFGNSRGEFEIDRDTYQDLFAEFFRSIGIDSYGVTTNILEKVYPEYIKGCTFENDVFIVRPYYWGDDEEIASLPNFEYKPDGLKICWYKYMMRDAYSNKELTVEYIKEVFKYVALSLPKLKDVKIVDTSTEELEKQYHMLEQEKIRKNSIYGAFGGGFCYSHKGGYNNDNRRN